VKEVKYYPSGRKEWESVLINNLTEGKKTWFHDEEGSPLK